jgi:hypothetical protein
MSLRKTGRRQRGRIRQQRPEEAPRVAAIPAGRIVIYFSQGMWVTLSHWPIVAYTMPPS